MDTCYITLPNKQIHEITFDPKQIGQVVLDKVLDLLDIIEVDFFGLQYYGPKKEELWLNLRNRFNDQIIGSSHLYQLKLKVKFFVQPQYIQQESTKELFYAQAKEALARGHIRLAAPHCDQCRLAQLVAHVAQAEYGDHVSNIYQRQTYSNILSELCGDMVIGEELLDKVAAEHAAARGTRGERCKYLVLQVLSELPGYGTEYHHVTSATNAEFNLSVGPHGLALINGFNAEERSIPYAQISLATHNDRAVHIQLIDDAGEPQTEECFKLVSRKAAVALYRSITEMHSFYRCDTVCPDVQSQYCRDFKGTFVSIFNENSELGKRFIFDIQRTSREAYDSVRRKLHAKSCSQPSSPTHTLYLSGTEEEDEDEQLPSQQDNNINPLLNKNKELKKENKRLKLQLAALEDSLLCCICKFAKVNVVLCPCGHMICDACSEKIDNACPQCRAHVESFQKVFQDFGLSNVQQTENEV